MDIDELEVSLILRLKYLVGTQCLSRRSWIKRKNRLQLIIVIKLNYDCPKSLGNGLNIKLAWFGFLMWIDFGKFNNQKLKFSNLKKYHQF
jgi:hypothetical protein